MRIRFTYHKNKAIRYTSTLDIQLFWERACRRAALPLAYSQGFHPQARIQQALPLPLGFTSLFEVVDIWFESDIPKESITQSLYGLRSLGIEIIRSEIIPDHAPSLQKEIFSSEYSVTWIAKSQPEHLPAQIAEFLSKTDFSRERNGKTYNLRPLVISIIVQEEVPPKLSMVLSAQEGATGRPEEVISSLGLDPFDFEYQRINITTKNLALN